MFDMPIPCHVHFNTDVRNERQFISSDMAVLDSPSVRLSQYQTLPVSDSPSVRLSQCQTLPVSDSPSNNIIFSKLKLKISFCFNSRYLISIQTFENVVCKMATGGYSKYMHLFEHIFTISYSNAALMKLVIFIMATVGYLDYHKSSPFQINKAHI